MQTTELFSATIEFDREATTISYGDISGPDVGCCEACATFAEMIRLNALPSGLVDPLRRLGIDPSKPQEVYGVPETGLIAGWWLFVGTIRTVWAGAAQGAFHEPSPGLHCWITDRLVVRSWPNESQTIQLVQIEFEWESHEVTRFARPVVAPLA
jgi:hypothetical protein